MILSFAHFVHLSIYFPPLVLTRSGSKGLNVHLSQPNSAPLVDTSDSIVLHHMLAKKVDLEKVNVICSETKRSPYVF